MDRFSRFNPKATLLFFTAEIVLTIAVFNPAFTIASFIGVCAYKIKLEGKRGVKSILLLALPLICTVAIFNFLFSHYGATVLFIFREMNFTLEAMFFGLFQGVMLAAVLMWFSALSAVITSEKLLSVFGRLAPQTALIFSMVLSFLPRLTENARQISEARRLLDNGKGSLKKSIDSFSALVTMTLEQSIVVADSMKARGYNKNRSVYSKYRFSIKDFVMLIFTASVALTVTVFDLTGRLEFVFEPVIHFEHMPPVAIICFLSLSFLPLITDFAEDIKWHYLKRKI